jgi:hypothetical protein
LSREQTNVISYVEGEDEDQADKGIETRMFYVNLWEGIAHLSSSPKSRSKSALTRSLERSGIRRSQSFNSDRSSSVATPTVGEGEDSDEEDLYLPPVQSTIDIDASLEEGKIAVRNPRPRSPTISTSAPVNNFMLRPETIRGGFSWKNGNTSIPDQERNKQTLRNLGSRGISIPGMYSTIEYVLISCLKPVPKSCLLLGACLLVPHLKYKLCLQSYISKDLGMSPPGFSPFSNASLAEEFRGLLHDPKKVAVFKLFAEREFWYALCYC